MPKGDTRFQPGKSGNPAGRPKNAKYFGETARELMAAKEIKVTWRIGDKSRTLKISSDKNMHYGIAAALIVEALQGNTVAARELIDRIDGKPHQSLAVEHDANLNIATMTRQQLEQIARGEYADR